MGTTLIRCSAGLGALLKMLTSIVSRSFNVAVAVLGPVLGQTRISCGRSIDAETTLSCDTC